ncbi:uncharacterized protein LOC129581909 [Paramacrobiotus metropolitanus]|uniref:uncharacterized protein LOC129581909 n=1 Tax=Paramacrobiotus metropolitanus TaxID=2943436 RepID=UPI002445C851|nr:uncharacterized protein LOC129581909 [Paramacrobiotus metropolitanus]
MNDSGMLQNSAVIWCKKITYGNVLSAAVRTVGAAYSSSIYDHIIRACLCLFGVIPLVREITNANTIFSNIMAMIWYKMVIASTILTIFLQAVAVYALDCYVCQVVLQSGEDCSVVRNTMLRKCQLNEDICTTTSVTLPGERIPTISRQCGKSVEMPTTQNGQPLINTFNTGHQESCTAYNEGARMSRLCQCNWNGCNGKSMQELGYGSGAGSVQPYLGCILVALALFFSRLM